MADNLVELRSSVRHLSGSPLRFAGCHDVVTLSEIRARIGQAVDRSLTSLRESGTSFDRCVILYWDHDADTPLLRSPEGCEVDVGWEVAAPYTDENAGVRTIETPEGMVAMATLVGPYENLPEAHRAIRHWCSETGVKRLGPNWEVFDHPREGEPPRTDVFYLVAG